MCHFFGQTEERSSTKRESRRNKTRMPKAVRNWQARNSKALGVERINQSKKAQASTGRCSQTPPQVDNQSPTRKRRYRSTVETTDCPERNLCTVWPSKKLVKTNLVVSRTDRSKGEKGRSNAGESSDIKPKDRCKRRIASSKGKPARSTMSRKFHIRARTNRKKSSQGPKCPPHPQEEGTEDHQDPSETDLPEKKTAAASLKG